MVAVLEALKKLGSASSRKAASSAVNILTFKENTLVATQSWWTENGQEEEGGISIISYMIELNREY